MNRKGLAILMRTRIRPSLSSLSSDWPTTISQSPPMKKQEEADVTVTPENSKVKQAADEHQRVDFRNLMSIAMSNQTSSNLDAVLNSFSEGYYSLCDEKRKELLLVLANEYDLDRAQLRQLMKQYLDVGDGVAEEEALLSTPFYRVEANLRNALMPKYQLLFQRLNANPGGFKFLTLLRAHVLSIIKTENSASLRALDSCLKELLITCLSPAALHLHHITWDDPASLLEKIVAYEAVHPISSLLDLKRRLGLGRRCFGYLHPAMPGEPLVFIEVALLKNVAQSIQEVLWDSPPIPESEATCALFYSISSTQPGLAGVNLGQFLIKRVIDKVKKEMPHVTDFATLSPIPGFMTWLLSKLASQSKLSQEATTDIVGSSTHNVGSAFRECILLPEEERQLVQASGTSAIGTDGMEVMWNLLKSRDYEWTKSEKLCSALQPALMRLCARYLLQEKLRGKALDSVANFHLQNGAMMERLNWMADRSEKGLTQSGGIMVNYIYRLDSIEENSKSYFSTGHINASIGIQHLIEK